MQNLRLIVEHTRKLQHFHVGRAVDRWPIIPTMGIPPEFRPEDLLALYSGLYEAVGRSGCKEATMFGLPRLVCYLLSHHAPPEPLSMTVWTNPDIEGVGFAFLGYHVRLIEAQANRSHPSLLDDFSASSRMDCLPARRALPPETLA